MLVAGLVVIALYLVLQALQVVGQPTDIGGGAILLLGYIVTIVGLAWVITDMIRGRA